MGTSSTRSGRTGNNSWKTAKSNVSKFFNGNASFGIAVKSLISAFGGSDYYCSNYRAKKNAAVGRLAGVIIGSLNSNLRISLESVGFVHPELKTPAELLVEYVNEIYPATNTPEDTLIREELLKEAYWYADCYDDNLRLTEEEDFIDEILPQHAIDSVAEEYIDILEFESTYSVEGKNAEEVLKNKAKATAELKELLDKFMKEYDGNKKDIKRMREFLLNKLDIYYEFGGGK